MQRREQQVSPAQKPRLPMSPSHWLRRLRAIVLPPVGTEQHLWSSATTANQRLAFKVNPFQR